jgi:hypothetical protein
MVFQAIEESLKLWRKHYYSMTYFIGTFLWLFTFRAKINDKRDKKAEAKKGIRQSMPHKMPPITGRITAVRWLMVKPTDIEGAISLGAGCFLKNELMAITKLKNKFPTRYIHVAKYRLSTSA